MAVYMLDTDISSYIMKRSHEAVLRRLQTVPLGDICISAITKSELMFGVEVSARRQMDQAALDGYLRHIEVLDYPDQAALHYAQIRGGPQAPWSHDWSARSVDCGACTLSPAHTGDKQHLGVWTRPGS